MNYKRYVLCILCFLCIFPKSSLSAKEEADYIVIGAGTAGATISKLLSDDLSTSVITIHNGKNLTQNPNIKYSRNAATTVLSALIGPPFFQTGFSPPQPSVDNREIFWAMGIPEGGTSSVNAGAWARGTNQVYSQWEPIAGPEWSTTQIQNIYTSLEKYKGLTPDPALRGYHGPIHVRQVPIPTPFSLKFSQAVAAATGVPIVVDYNDINTPIGVSPQLQYTQKGCNGKFRVSSATAFLGKNVVTPNGKGVGGRKLNIKYKSTALRTLWKDNKAIGVVYSRNGIERKVYAKKGVVVCGGLYSSAFLMHSGVGPKEVLQPLGIEVKFDNPNVGAALADQTLLLGAFTTNPNDTPIQTRKSLNQGLIDHLSFHKLRRTLFNLPVIANLPNANDKEQLARVLLSKDFSFPENSIFSQIAWLPTPGGDPTIRTVRITTVNPIPGLAVALIDLVQPQSRGRITINSADPLDPPVIDSGIFTNPADLELYVQAFQIYIKNINATLHAMDEQYALIFPPPAILDDVVLLTAFIKEFVGSNQCWQSHCRMAPLNQGGVVNSIGQVYGVQNLYVADDSIIPVAMDGTPMASAYLIAANIARLLQQ
jgi:choline dehydrogenase-like flavoprotein